MELRVIYENEEMRDMVVHVNSEGLQKIMSILADENNIIITQLTPRAADGLWVCRNCYHYNYLYPNNCAGCGSPRR